MRTTATVTLEATIFLWRVLFPCFHCYGVRTPISCSDDVSPAVVASKLMGRGTTSGAKVESVRSYWTQHNFPCCNYIRSCSEHSDLNSPFCGNCSRAARGAREAWVCVRDNRRMRHCRRQYGFVATAEVYEGVPGLLMQLHCSFTLGTTAVVSMGRAVMCLMTTLNVCKKLHSRSP